MTRCQYTPEFKSKFVLNILQGNQELNEICAQHNLDHNIVRKWKHEFLKMLILYFVQNLSTSSLRERRVT